jgi:hypothetical protein
MIRINLLPVKQIKKVLKAKNEVIAFLLALLGLVVVILGTEKGKKLLSVNNQ